MAELEKVIKGLEKIAEFFKARGDMAVGDGKMLLLSWMRAAEDAIALLKEQEPRVMARWEYKHRHRKSYRQCTGFDSIGEIHTITVLEETEGEEPYCSNCGAQAAESFLNYCPRCGAQMASRPTDKQKETIAWQKPENG